MPTRAQISPKIVDWALKRSHSSVPSLAAKLDLSEGKLSAWAAGASYPTFRQAQALADALSIPFGYLFLSRPPEKELILPDFRRHPDGSSIAPTPDVIDAVNDIQLKQDWYRDYQVEMGAQGVSFVGSFSTNERTEVVASNIREAVGLTEQIQSSASDPDALLRGLIRHAESIGVLVMRSGTIAGNTHRPLPMREFRGFALSDSLAPTIFINSSDSKTGQLFTLAHELAHVWLGSSGISPSAAIPSPVRRNDATQIEWFCNQVAADFLLPRETFHRYWREYAELGAKRAERIARRLRVSYLASLIRASELDLIHAREARRLIEEEKQRIESLPARPKSEGGNFYATFFARNSERFTIALLEATKEGRVFYQEAANLLGVKVPTIDKLVDKVLER